ncbi:magnesium transporter MgtE N-terminal domain-containing protein [uncultured Acetobacteroides sp.]|uniref:magnesium transporter n=1 Tax=uncultured Acetobacteroides sp. TaxID=1760811 RepID=UPI0029F52891|nr:CBS domain-containing protein [uncultured Acetobacteroides sp.]
MTTITTFYFSRVVGCKVFDVHKNCLGKVVDFVMDLSQAATIDGEPFRPQLNALLLKHKGKKFYISFTEISVAKAEGRYLIFIDGASQIDPSFASETLLLGQGFLDQQIVDLNGRKVVRVNDIRMVSLSNAIFAIAVDVGIEGLLRRLGVVKQVAAILKIFNIGTSSHFILMDDVAAVDNSSFNIKLSKTASKLDKLHPSDLADIIEDLGKDSQTSIFSSLDEEIAADVLEELEMHEQIHIIESLSVEKAADVLEKMPANEAADILDELEADKAELLLKEMETESSEEVRELLEYPDNSVGSFMTTEVLSFTPDVSINTVLDQIRETKPEMDMLYNIFVVDAKERLVATVSLRDLIVSQPDMLLKDVMKCDPISVYDTEKIDSLAEIVSKYNLLSIPVTNEDDQLEGMVVIDDVVEDLVGKRRTL